jgi:ribosomal protein S18 acetylase RimI-like enzyme
MTDDLKIRAMLLEELPWLLPFWAKAAARESATDDVISINILLKERDDAVLIAEIDGQKSGTVIAVFDGWRGNIYRLAVLTDYRKRGIARRLVQQDERRLAIRGAKRLVALASQHSETAAPFWDSMVDEGWRLSHPKQRYAKTLDR